MHDGKALAAAFTLTLFTRTTPVCSGATATAMMVLVLGQRGSLGFVVALIPLVDQTFCQRNTRGTLP